MFLAQNCWWATQSTWPGGIEGRGGGEAESREWGGGLPAGARRLPRPAWVAAGCGLASASSLYPLTLRIGPCSVPPLAPALSRRAGPFTWRALTWASLAWPWKCSEGTLLAAWRRKRWDIGDFGTGWRPHAILLLGPGQQGRSFRVRGAAQLRSRASQATGLASRGVAKAALPTSHLPPPTSHFPPPAFHFPLPAFHMRAASR